MLRLREKGSLFGAHIACLSKVVVLCGTFECTSKRYIEIEGFALLEREGAFFRARFACLSEVVIFCGTFECTTKRYVERETSLVARERESTFQGSLSSPLKGGGFLWHF